MQVYTVTELATYLKAALDRDPALRDVWVSGEVSSLTRSAAGHSYFTLKDAGAALQAVLFAGEAGAEHLDGGAQVNARGRVSFYLVRGVTQIIVDAVVPAGLGALAAEFERLRAMLERGGLFDPSRKRPLPPFPRRVGVVTSETGAVIHDITTVLAERYPLVELVLCPASVQGESAPAEIADGIRYIRGNAAVRSVLTVNLVLETVSMPYFFLLPGFVAEVLDGGAFEIGTLLSISGIGALAGSLLIASLPNRRRAWLMLASSLLLGASLVGFAASTQYWLSALLFIVVGFGQDGSDESDHGGVVGEDPDDSRAAFNLFVDPLERVR